MAWDLGFGPVTLPKESKYLFCDFPKIRGTLLGVPQNKDYSILGSILGSPYFGKLPYGYSSPNHASDYQYGGPTLYYIDT